jgi:hypothetical protein
VLALVLSGEDDKGFANNHMGNPWHWD